MTLTEIQDQWQNYMHRNDLAGDMAVTTTFAEERIKERLMADTVDLAEILASSPLLYLYAGLLQLMQLAEDNDGMTTNDAMFEKSIQNYALRRSITLGRAQMRKYDGTEELA